MIAAVERNIRLYPIYRAAADAMAWLPIFFLYFSERLTLPQVLLLEAIYYLCVVVTEVPSGYLSDVVGRKRTLILSGLALIAAYLCFLLANQFTGLAAGQCLVAISIAFRSGTDTAFHFESLQAANRQLEYGDREARAGKYGFASTAVAALAGGILGTIDLALPYWLSLVAAFVSLGLVFRFVEPNTQDTRERPHSGFIKQLNECFRYLSHPLVKWLFLYFVVMYTIVHIPYEFYQPYLALLEDDNRLAGIDATLLAGILFALTAVVASVASAYSMQWQRKLGLLRLLKLAAVVELFIVAAMAILLNPLIASLMLLRSGPMAVIQAPINAALAPIITNAHRATFLSLKNLVAKLLFAVLLVGFSAMVTETGTTDWASLSLLLRTATVIGLSGLVFLHFLSAGQHNESGS